MKELYRFRQFLTEGVIKEELVDKIKQIKDYNETEDSLNYGGYDITYDRDENLYNVFSKEGDSDSSDIPDFESSNPSAIEDFLLNEDIMVNPIIMFGGKDYIKNVIASPDDFGFDTEDAGWIKNNILTAPKMVSIEDYMALEDGWVKQADLDVGTGADRESVLDAINVHVKQGLITPEEGEKAKKIALKF